MTFEEISTNIPLVNFYIERLKKREDVLFGRQNTINKYSVRKTQMLNLLGMEL